MSWDPKTLSSNGYCVLLHSQAEFAGGPLERIGMDLVEEPTRSDLGGWASNAYKREARFNAPLDLGEDEQI